MTNNEQEASAVIRFGAFDASGNRVATLKFEGDRVQGAGDKAFWAAVRTALKEHSTAPVGFAELEQLLVAAGASLALSVRRIGEADIVFNAELTAAGLVAGRFQAMEGAEPFPPAVQKALADILASIGPRLADELAAEIEARAEEPEKAAAHLLAAKEAGRLALAPTVRLGNALAAIDADALDDAVARTVLTLRAAVASQLGWDAAAAREAQILLERWDDHAPDLAFELRNLVAMAHLRAGRRETAITIWSELASLVVGISPEQRAQVFRNLAHAASPTDKRALTWIEQSADLFRQAGNIHESVVSHVGWGHLLEHHDALQAVAMIESANKLLNSPGPTTEAFKAALHFVRARRLAALERSTEALEAALRSVDIRRGLAGQEDELLASLALAEELARRCKDPIADDLERESAERLEDVPSQHFAFAGKVQALLGNWDAALAAEIRDHLDREQNPSVRIGAQIALIVTDPEHDNGSRLSLLEELHGQSSSGEVPRSALTPVRLAIAQTIREAGDLRRASDWLQAILDDDPLAEGIAHALFDALAVQGDWPQAQRIASREIALKGDSFARLARLAKASIEAGDQDAGASAALAARELAFEDEQQTEALSLLEDALRAGGSLAAARKRVPVPVVTIAEFEDVLRRFGKKVSTDYRMSYWRSEGIRGHRWVAKPERHAQLQLRMWLDGAFGGRVFIFEELSTGAGRLDLLVQLAGGTQVILELKMLGHGYSSTYATDGEEQIRHYLTNRGVHVGFLVVFDARSQDNGASVMPLNASGGYDIQELLIDVYPSVRRRAAADDTGKP